MSTNGLIRILLLFFCLFQASAFAAPSWEIVHIDVTHLDLKCLFFINPEEGWAAGHTGALKTEDGGNSWDTIYQVNIGGHPHFQALWFMDEKQGWAASYLGLLQTLDGGKSWKQKEEGLFFDLFFVGKRHGWAVGAGILGDGIIIHTEDGGEHWQIQESGVGKLHLNGVYFINEDEGWLVGDDGIILTTKNGGQKWIPQHTPLKHPFYAPQFFNSKEGWILGGSTFHTEDGGEHWEEQLFPEGHYLISDLKFVNRREGWAVGGLFANDGGHSIILNTTDGGRTWKKLEKTIKGILHGIEYAGDGTLYAVGDYGVILKYVDPTLRSETEAVTPLDKQLTTWASQKTALLQNFPNPFNPETWIPYQLAVDASVEIVIYNARGQLIRTLVTGRKPAGSYLGKKKAIHWDGRNQRREKVASGMYFYTLTAGDFSATRKMIVAR